MPWLGVEPGLEASNSSNRIARIVYMDTYGAFDTPFRGPLERRVAKTLLSPWRVVSEALSEEKVGETVRSDRGLDRIEAPSIGHTQKPFSSMTAVQTSDPWVGLKSFMFGKVSSIARPASFSPMVCSQGLTSCRRGARPPLVSFRWRRHKHAQVFLGAAS
jgi:hypothetical protein